MVQFGDYVRHKKARILGRVRYVDDLEDRVLVVWVQRKRHTWVSATKLVEVPQIDVLHDMKMYPYGLTPWSKEFLRGKNPSEIQSTEYNTPKRNC